MRILKIFRETISDGPGFRYSIYFSGCSHACPGCHNEESWNPDNGEVMDSKYFKKITDEINGNKMLSGITISGGDPFYDSEEFLDFLVRLRKETGDIVIDELAIGAPLIMYPQMSTKPFIDFIIKAV